jgi:alpha-L-fucosidase
MQQIERAHFEPTWESLAGFTVPDWYHDAKFGIFMHWGLYSVPAFRNEWYSRNMYLQDTEEFKHHVATYGPHTQFGYKDFIPMFKAERFDPDRWAELFKRAGARYIVPVAEHHDGFAMYDSALSRWTAAKLGPCRDVIGELAAAVRRQGLTFGLSSHRAEHWWFMNGGQKFPSDVQDPAYTDFYGPAMPDPAEKTAWEARDWEPRPDTAYLEDWFARACELVDKYAPQLVYFDWWVEQLAFEPYLRRFAAYYYNRVPNAAINYKQRAFPVEAGVFDMERGQLADIRPQFWQTCTSVSRNSWCYVSEQEYRTVDSLIDDLVDIVSKNGTLLLNIGPRADGTIAEPEIAILEAIGAWLRINGEAIYGSRPWKIFGEGVTEVKGGSFSEGNRAPFTGQDIRFTTQGDVLYATFLAWPGDLGVIQALGTGSGLWPGEISGVQLLGHDGVLHWTRTSTSLTIEMPTHRPCDHAFVLKIMGS